MCPSRQARDGPECSWVSAPLTANPPIKGHSSCSQESRNQIPNAGDVSVRAGVRGVVGLCVCVCVCVCVYTNAFFSTYSLLLV